MKRTEFEANEYYGAAEPPVRWNREFIKKIYSQIYKGFWKMRESGGSPFMSPV